MNRDDEHVYFSARHASWLVAGMLCGLLLAWLMGFWCGRRRAQAFFSPRFVMVQTAPEQAHEQTGPEADAPLSGGFYARIATYDSYVQALDLCARAQVGACPLRIVKTSFILKNNKPYTSYQVLTVVYPTRQALDDILVALESHVPGAQSAVICTD